MSSAPSVPVAPLARIAQDVGLAGLVGGNLFGRLALHPSLVEIADPAERGKVVNATWRRAGSINGLGLLAVVGGWSGSRGAYASTARTLGDVLVGVTAVTGVATAIEGVRFARQEPGGAVPLTDGAHASPQATDAETSGKQRLDRLGSLGLVAELALVALTAAARPAPEGRRALLKQAISG